MSIDEGENGLAEARLCVYDELYYDVFGVSAPEGPFACLDAGYRWAYIGGPGTCLTIRDVRQPTACANGYETCALAFLGEGYWCRIQQ